MRALRPAQWIKNVVVFAAPLFALALGAGSLFRTLGALAVFCAASSAFYLVNDVLDREADRAHPVKRHRPVASGALPVPAALAVAGLLLAGGLAGGALLAPWLGAVVAAYALVQVGYNAGLKREPVLDVMCIAGGFVLRALGGAAAARVPASGWFVLCVGLLAFFLGIEKRKAELRAAQGDHSTRAVLDAYSLRWLERMESVVTASALMAYALWTLEGAGTPWMLATVPFVMYGIFRYQYLTEQGLGEAPERVLLRSPLLLLNVACWATSSGLILYFLT
jgi:4-hydroxybenzoate polyprenyltransferase